MTGEIARMFMSWWDRQMTANIKNDGVKIVMYKWCVDYIIFVIESAEAYILPLFLPPFKLKI